MRKWNLLFIELLILALFPVLWGCAPSEKSTNYIEPLTQESAAETPPQGILSRDVVPLKYHLIFELNPNYREFVGQATIDIKINKETSNIWFHGKDLSVESVELTIPSGETFTGQYEQVLESGVAKVAFDNTIKPSDATLKIRYIANLTTDYYGLFQTKEKEQLYIASDMQPTGARQAFPGFDDPQFKTPFDIDLIIPDGMQATSNGIEISRESIGNGRTKVDFAETRVLPTYLIAIMVGNYDVVEKNNIVSPLDSNISYPLRGFAAAGSGAMMLYGLENTYPMLEWQERYFDIPYPFRKLDLITVPGKFSVAMENAAAITYNSFLMLLDDDSSFRQKRWHTLIHIHELTHQWFGNLVTPVWWDDLWLNEAFATWMMYKAASVHWSDGQFESLFAQSLFPVMTTDSASSAKAVRRPVPRNEDIMNSFDRITYDKGAAVIGMIEHFIGEENFQASIRHHVSRFADKNATTDDFYKSIADVTGDEKVIHAFNSFINQAGIPLLNIDVDCNGDSPSISASQQRYVPLGVNVADDETTWYVPFCFTTNDKKECVWLTEQTQDIPIESNACPTWINPNTLGAGYYRYSLSAEYWANLIGQVDSMSDKEIALMINNLDASFASGKLSATDYWNQLEGLLQSENREVQFGVLEALRKISTVITPAYQPQFQEASGALISPLLADLNLTSLDIREKRWNLSLFSFAAEVAHIDEFRDESTQHILAYIADPENVELDRDLMLTQILVAVEETEGELFDRLISIRSATSDTRLAAAIIQAIASANDKRVKDALKNLLLNNQFEGRDTTVVVRSLLSWETDLASNIMWIDEHFDHIISRMPAFNLTRNVARLGEGICDKENKVRWETVINNNKGKIPGYESPHAQAMEKVDMCIATRKLNAESLLNAFMM